MFFNKCLPVAKNKCETYEKEYAPGDLEDAEEASAAEDREAERRHEVRLHERALYDAPEHHCEVEPIELAEEVALEAVREHLQQDLQREHRQERHVCPVCRVRICNAIRCSSVQAFTCSQVHSCVQSLSRLARTLDVAKPLRLAVVLAGERAGVEKYEENHEPVKHLRLHQTPSAPPQPPVQLVPAPAPCVSTCELTFSCSFVQLQLACL